MCWDRIFCISQSVCWGRDQGEFAPGLSPTGGREGLGGYLGGYADSCRLQGRPIVHAHAHIHTHTYTQHPQLTHTLKPNHIPPTPPCCPTPHPTPIPLPPHPPRGNRTHPALFFNQNSFICHKLQSPAGAGGSHPCPSPPGAPPRVCPAPASVSPSREHGFPEGGSPKQARLWGEEEVESPQGDQLGGHRGWSREGLGTEERLLGGGVQLAPRDRPPLASGGVAVP